MKKIFLLICTLVVIFFSACGKTEEKADIELDTSQSQLIETSIDVYVNEEDAVDYANGECGQNVTWRLSENGVLVISGSGEMNNFPYDDYVPWHDFRDMIVEVKIKSGVTSIGRYAFQSCNNLETVTMADTVVKMEYSAFQNCTSLRVIDLSDSIEELPKQAFSDCTELESIELPKNLQRVQDYAFCDCISLKEVTFPEKTWYIANDVFRECSALETVYFPDILKVIGCTTFAFCDNLQTITIPAKVKNLSDTFLKCRELKEVYFKGDAPVISDRTFKEVTATCYYPSGNRTWTISKMSDYGGNLTWVAE